MVIKHNRSAAYAQREMNIVTEHKQKSAERLSSGYRINRAADDAAGLSISEKLRWQVRGLGKASNNIQDGISLIQVADGALNEAQAVLQRMRELAVQAANDTNTDADRGAIQQEIDQLRQEVDRIAKTTTFNGDIYPICNTQSSSGATTGWELPSYLSIHQMVIQNTTTSIVKWDGVEYNPGETFTASYIVYDAAKNANSTWPKVNAAYRTGTKGLGDCYNAISLQSLEQTMQQNILNNGGYSVTSWDVESDGVIYFNTADGAKIYFAVSDDGNGSSLGTQRSSYCDYYFKAVKDAANQGNARVSELRLQVGSLAGQGITFERIDATADALGISYLDIGSYDEAGKTMSLLDNAIEKVSEYRSGFGALQNRLEHSKSIDDNTLENTQAAESQIRDANMAKEMLDYSKHSILEQAGQAMLTQANQSKQGVLQLLQS